FFFFFKKDIDTLIAQEKEEIIAKYEKGRQEGAQIDPWEDADFTLYKVFSWGYFLKFVLSSSPLHQQKQQEIERVDKWLKMLKKWSKYRNSDKVRRKRKSMCLEGQEWCILPVSQAFKKLIEKPEITGKYYLILPISL
uniref:Uncharacterized protein n=1 Tax=Athene cunicularia TaxID=194338 RepID=A0A663M9V1_ATHCN